MYINNIIKNKTIFEKETIMGKIQIKGKIYLVQLVISGIINYKNEIIKISKINKLHIKPYDRLIKNVLIEVLKTDPNKIIVFKNNKLSFK